MTMSNRAFGVEIECLPPVGTRGGRDAFTAVAAALRAAGVEAHVQYTHVGTAPSGWTVKPDGSVYEDTASGRVTGVEVVSQPMTGDAGLAEIDRVCAVLNAHGYWVNHRCGLHVHVDRPAPGACRRLAYDYARFESIVDSFMPATRRGNAATYARSISAASDFRAVAGARDASALVRLIGTVKYVKVNFKTQTVEFRQHSGTTSAEKIKNWVKMCLRFAARAEANPIAFSGVDSVPIYSAPVFRSRRRRLGRRRQTFVRLITRPEGATRDEIFAATGWRNGSLSMIRFARESNLVLARTRLASGAYRYYGRSGTAAEVAAMPTREAELPNLVAEAPTPATLENLFAILAVPADEEAYWRDRIAHHNRTNVSTRTATEATL